MSPRPITNAQSLTYDLTVRIDRATKNRLRRAAQREERSESSIVRLALRDYLEKEKAT